MSLRPSRPRARYAVSHRHTCEARSTSRRLRQTPRRLWRCHRGDLVTAPHAPTEPPQLYLLDASGYVFRAFHALPAAQHHARLPTNAVYGVANMLLEARCARSEPEHLAVVLRRPGRDVPRRDVRASTRPTVADAGRAAAAVRPTSGAGRGAAASAASRCPGVEADDVIGTLAAQAARAGQRGRHRHRRQGHDAARRPSAHAPRPDARQLGLGRRRGARSASACRPSGRADVLGLMGDAIDNIPGVKGIGEKTASALVSAARLGRGACSRASTRSRGSGCAARKRDSREAREPTPRPRAVEELARRRPTCRRRRRSTDSCAGRARTASSSARCSRARVRSRCCASCVAAGAPPTGSGATRARRDAGAEARGARRVAAASPRRRSVDRRRRPRAARGASPSRAAAGRGVPSSPVGPPRRRGARRPLRGLSSPEVGKVGARPEARVRVRARRATACRSRGPARRRLRSRPTA